MCVESQLPELFIESVDDTLHGSYEPTQAIADTLPLVIFDTLNKYSKGELRFDVYPVWKHSSRPHNFDSDDVIFSVERVTSKPLTLNDVPTGGSRAGKRKVTCERRHAYNTQPTVPIHPGQVVDVLKCVLQPTIRVVARFISRARLYRPHPINELLGEWESVETTVLDISGLPLAREGEFQTTQALCIGGRLASLDVGDRIPYQAVKSRSELISELSKFEAELVGFYPSDTFGTKNDPLRPPPGTFIVVSDGSSCFSLKEGVPFAQKGYTVHPRSLNPAPAVFKTRGHSR